MNATSLESSGCTDDQAFHILHRYLDLSFHWTGVVLNMVLLYLVNNHSGSNVGPYKNVFRLTCASDLTVSFFAMIGQKTILVDSGNLVFFSNSILSRRWPLLDFFAVFGVTGNHFMNTVFLPMQYVYRYLSLCSDERTRKRVMGISYLVCSFVCIYGFLAAANALLPTPEWQERALLIVRETGWSCAALDGEKIFLFGAYFYDTKFMVYIWSLSFVTVAGYVIVVVSEVLLVKKIHAIGVTTDKRALRMQAQFKRALTALAVCPLIFVFVPVAYFVITGMFEMKCSLYSTVFTMLTSSIALANPLVTIVTVRPYRLKVMEWFSAMTGKRFCNAVTDTTLVTSFSTYSKTKSQF